MKRSSFIISISVLLFLSSCSFFSEEGKAIDIAKYNIIQKQLKNPDSMYSEDFKVLDKMKYRLTAEDIAGDYTLWFIHGNITASNSFGANLKQGYCVVFFTGKGGDVFGQDFVVQECSRDNPTAQEITIIKNLFGWDKYKKVAIQ
jgi:hypothetical protein